MFSLGGLLELVIALQRTIKSSSFSLLDSLKSSWTHIIHCLFSMQLYSLLSILLTMDHYLALTVIPAEYPPNSIQNVSFAMQASAWIRHGERRMC